MIQHSAAARTNRRLPFPAAAGTAILLVFLMGYMASLSVTEPDDPAVASARPATGVTMQDACMEAVYHEVVRVVDGDTIIVMVDGSRERIRLIGIDAPETAGVADSGGLEATLRLEGLLGGKSVMLAKDVSERDAYGRLLRYVWLDAHTCVNLVLAEEGLAKVMHIPPDSALQEDLRLAEQRAREAGLGLWSR